MSTAKNVGIGVGLTSSACAIMVFGISFGNFIKKNAAQEISKTQQRAAVLFEGLAIFGKGGGILALIILALINGHGDYVAKNPKKFMQDALATGGFGAIAAVFLTLTRGRPDLWANHLVFALMLFFLYHVCREFAGYFTIFGSDEKSTQIEKQEKMLGKPLLIAGGVMALFAIILALVARTSPDFTRGIFKSFAPSTALMLETVIFVAIITGGEVIVARNHEEPLGPAVGSSILMFTVAHLVLQSGGFYGHLYAPNQH